jgi:hypothetical protein
LQKYVKDSLALTLFGAEASHSLSAFNKTSVERAARKKKGSQKHVQIGGVITVAMARVRIQKREADEVEKARKALARAEKSAANKAKLAAKVAEAAERSNGTQ